MRIEEIVWDTFKALEKSGNVKLNGYEIVDNPTDELYFKMMNKDKRVSMDVNGKLVYDTNGVEFDPEEFDSMEDYISYQLSDIDNDMKMLCSARPKVMVCHITLIGNDGTRDMDKLFVIPR